MERPELCLDLFDLISVYGPLEESLARFIFRQIVKTVHSLYINYGIFHRDIKVGNILK